MLIRAADASDNAGLQRLASRTGMAGAIRLRIDRKPDFFALLRERGTALVLVAEHEGEIVGSYSAVQEQFRVLGREERIWYLGDLRIDPAFRGTSVTFQLVRDMLQHPVGADADILFGTAAAGNERVTAFFAGRAGFPRFVPLGAFRVLQMLPSRGGRRDACPTAVTDDTAGMHEVFNRFTRRYQFAKLFRDDAFRDCAVVTASAGGAVRAWLALVDVRAMKQNVLLRIPRGALPLLAALRIANLARPTFTIPRANEPLAMLYVRAFAVEDGYERCLDAAIRCARRYASERRYTFLAAGVHERDPLARLFGRHARFTFISLGYITSLKQRWDAVDAIAAGVSFEDYSLI